MKQITLTLAAGIMLCLISCTGGKTEQKTEEAAAFTPFKIMLVKHPVNDFTALKAGYFAHDSMRQANGLNHLGLGRGMEDSNMVVVVNRIADVQKAKDFAASAELKEAMDKVGVSGPPTIAFLDVIRNDTTEIPQIERVMVNHRVKDFDAWLKVYDGEGNETRAANGLLDRGMARDIDDPNMVYILFAITDMAKAKARMESEDLKKIMTEAGVEGPPSFFFYTIAD